MNAVLPIFLIISVGFSERTQCFVVGIAPKDNGARPTLEKELDAADEEKIIGVRRTKTSLDQKAD